MTADELEADILHKNIFLGYAKNYIGWTRGVNPDFSNFAGVNWHPGLIEGPVQVYSIKWTNNFSVGGSTAYHNFRIEVTLMKEDEGTDRCFRQS